MTRFIDTDGRWERIETTSAPFSLKGKTMDAVVYIDVTEDDVDPAGGFDFGDDVTNAEYLARFHSGELSIVIVRVTVVWKGLAGSAYLGGCHVKAGDVDDATGLARDNGMIDEALADLVREIEQRLADLEPFTRA